MNPLQSRLAALRRRLLVVVTVRGACLAAAVLLGCLFLAVLLDLLVHWKAEAGDTWALLRAVLLVGTLSGTGVILYWALWRPFAARTDDLSLALRVEEQYPILNDALASTVQFLEQQQQGRVAVSPAMQKEAVQRALRLAQGCDFNKAVDARGLTWSVVLLMLASVATLMLFIGVSQRNPAEAKMALVRFADPFGDHPWALAARTQLEVRYPRLLAYGQPLKISGDVRGHSKLAEGAKVTIEFDSAVLGKREPPIEKLSDTSGTFEITINLDNPPAEVRFRVHAGDAVSPMQTGSWHVVSFRPPPQLAALNGKPSPQITLQQPRYADLPEYEELPAGTGNITVLAGTVVTLKAAADRPLERVWVEFQPEVAEINTALALAAFGPRQPVDVLAATGLAYGVWGKIPGKVAKNGTEFSVRFMPWVTGAYVLWIQDKDGLAKSYSFGQVVDHDPVPTVEFLRPTTSLSVVVNAEVTLEILARDEKFALKSVWLEYRRKDKTGAWLDDEPKKLHFYDHDKTGRALPLVLNSLPVLPLLVPALPLTPKKRPLAEQAAPATVQVLATTGPLRLRPKMLLIAQRWSLQGLAVEGETLVIRACADDFCDVIAFREPGRSSEIELKIVGKAALSGVIAEAESKIHQQLVRLRDMQDKALKKVLGVEQQWRATGKLRAGDLEELAEAERLQKDIEIRIGIKKDEGLRDEIAQLEQLHKDNKLPRSEIADRLKVVREALEKLSKDHLPKIEPGLAKARRELENPDPVEIPLPHELGDIGAARTEQDTVHQTLDELVQFLDERAPLAQIRAELRIILQEQQDLREEVEGLQAKENVLKDNVQLKVTLRKTAELQRRLADRTQKVVNRIQQLRDQFSFGTLCHELAQVVTLDRSLHLEEELRQLKDRFTGKDEEVAEMLALALKIAHDPPEFQDIVLEMRDTATKQLRDDFDLLPKPKKPWVPNLPRALGNQKECIECLEKMLEALEQSRAAEIEKLTKKQKNQEQHLDDLAKKQADLQKEIERARKIDNKEQRDAALKKLADEQRALAQLAQKKARELDLLQAPDAAADLDAAAKKMERAAKELDDGVAPKDDLKNAIQKIDDAKAKLQDAQDEAREELTREQLAKIVDRLQGLKERQDMAIEEVERLHKTVLQGKQWRRPMLESLLADREAQDGLAKETASLADKLKGAKVYHMMLDDAAKNMAGAVDQLKKHLDFAKPIQDPKFLDDKQIAEDSRQVQQTIKYQKEASDDLQNLIDALLPELEPKTNPKTDPKEGGGGGGGDKGGLKAQDGIPPVAQLKALRAKQLVVNARTKAFAEQHPDFSKLTRREAAALADIHAQQDRLRLLFVEMATSGNEEGKKQ